MVLCSPFPTLLYEVLIKQRYNEPYGKCFATNLIVVRNLNIVTHKKGGRKKI